MLSVRVIRINESIQFEKKKENLEFKFQTQLILSVLEYLQLGPYTVLRKKVVSQFQSYYMK